jgi:RNA polymerase sigma factor (sigma-70 family)
MSRIPYDNEATGTDELVEALRNGDDAAGAFLVSRHAPLLLGYAGLVASDIPETDREMVCEVTVERAVDRIDQFNPQKGSFEGWLRGILRNEIKAWRRGRTAIDELDESRVAAPTVDAPTEARELVNAPAIVAELLAQLSESDQLIVRMRDLEEVPYSFIARVLDVREDACRQRHKRALERLQSLAPLATALDRKLEEPVNE